MDHRSTRTVETLVVGAGQAGLVVSGLLRGAGREHVVLERRATLGGGWQDRWDAFRLVSPNWTMGMAGFPYRGSDPDAFSPRDAIIDHFRAYAAFINAPVELETDVTALEALGDGPGNGSGARFRLSTSRGPILARNVVIAGGPFQVPHLPPISASIDPSITQLHSHDYRNPEALPPGGVLLIGSGQSGVQLAEELMAAGRSVTIAVGKCGRVPRTYRGRDIFWWLRALATMGPGLGITLPTAADLPDPRARFACNPQLSGHGDRHDTNLREMAARGLRPVGRLDAAEGTRLRFSPGLRETLAFADTFFRDRFQGKIDTFVERAGLDVPTDEVSQFDHEPDEIAELDLATEGISTVIWTSGYRPGFGWVKLPVLDELGLPRQTGGRTDVPGLSFIGTPWLVDQGSANLVGLERDATALVEAAF